MAGLQLRGEASVQKIDPYYALCTEDEEGKREIASLHLRHEEGYGDIVGISVYTTLDGELQRADVAKWEGKTVVSPVTREELLDEMNQIVPSSVFLDGKKLAGSVFRGMIKGELGLPIKHPRPVRIDNSDD
jgi:hypothetical protein